MGDLPDIFLLLISSLIPYGLRHTWYYFCSFKCHKACFIVQNVVYVGVCATQAWEECVFWCHWMEYSTNVNEIKFIDGAFKSGICLLISPFALSTDNGERSVECPTTNIVISIISFQFYHFLSHMFWHSLLRFIHSLNCFLFLKSWSLYHYVMTYIIADNFSYSESKKGTATCNRYNPAY